MAQEKTPTSKEAKNSNVALDSIDRETSPSTKKRQTAPEPSTVEEPSSKKAKIPKEQLIEEDFTDTKRGRSHVFDAPKQDSGPSKERFPSPPDESATALDKETWQGYCEIESEPAYFSVILREIGVQGITVREVPFLSPDVLSFLPNPIFGLIILFRHRDIGLGAQEETCPSNVWFANQMPFQNSCATLAMIHALLNIAPTADIDVGEHLRQFKDFSKDLTPYQRGEAFASWRFVKKIHNSFAKKMDMLENDKYLAAKANRAVQKSKEKRRASKDSNASDDSAVNFEENAHHYIAFVPIEGKVWKLDGMDAQPTCHATYDDGQDWTEAITDTITALMAAGGDDYGVYAISQSPMVELRKQIIVADNTARHVERRLTAINTDWKSFVAEEDLDLPSPSFLGSISESERAAFPTPDHVQADIDAEPLHLLLDRRSALVRQLRQLAMELSVQEGMIADENAAAEARRWDYGPSIKTWLEMLAENGWLQKNLHLFPAEQ